MLLELCTPLTYLWLSSSAFLLLSCLDLFPSQNYPCGRPNKGEAIQRLISPRSTRGYTIKTQEKKDFTNKGKFGASLTLTAVSQGLGSVTE